MSKILFVVIGFVFFLNSASWAETIYLKNGKKISGKIIERGDDSTKVDIKGVTVTYFKEEIDRIEEGSPQVQAPIPAAPKPTPSAVSPAPAPALAAPPAAVVPASVPAASEDKKALILKLVVVSGTRDSMNEMFQQIISGASPKDSVKLKQIFDLDELIQRFVPLYDKYFTTEDLNELIKFYYN